MTDRNPLTEILHDSNELWRLGEPRKALKCLDKPIDEAVHRDDRRALAMLARHAAIISESIGDLALARQYNERVLACAPDNLMALYGLAKILSSQGQTDLAKQYARKCYEVGSHGTSDLSRAVLELLNKQWPNIEKLND